MSLDFRAFSAGATACLAAGLSLCLMTGAVAAVPSAELAVTQAWARATPGNAANGAAYLTITSPTADRLVAVQTPVAATAQLHSQTMTDGIMRMRPLDGVDIPAGTPVMLKPGGTHIMLMGLKQALREGQSFPLMLNFAKAGQRQITVAVETLGAMGPAPQSQIRH